MSEQTLDNVRPRVNYDSLRDWIEQTAAIDELMAVEGASWDEEIGAVTDMLQHDERAPAVMFDSIPGYGKGYRILCNSFGGKRQNLILGFPTSLTKVELSEAFRVAYGQIAEKRLPVEVVEDGPVLENVLSGDDIDLYKFPTPLWHEDDGGRYIGTGCANVTVDPDTGWINLGTYRVMIQDKSSAGLFISPGKHGLVHSKKYIDRGEPIPVCVVIGADPLTFLMSCNSLPHDVSEYEVAGAYRGRPIKVIKGARTGLPFPADAEIVLEGFIHPGRVRPEGPFGEWSGHYGSPVADAPVIDIETIYHRNDPIIVGCPPQRPPGENSRYRAVMRSALLRQEVIQAGVPDVDTVWCHEVGGSRMLVAISIKQRYPGHPKQAAHVASQCGGGAYAGKYVVVVDSDVDASNLEDLIWAMVFRSDPATSIDIIHGARSTPLDPSIPPWEKAKKNYTNSRAIIDACRPYHWRDQYPKVNMPSPDIMEKVRVKFGHLVGLKS